MKKSLTSYDILSLSDQASQSDIHAAYRKLAKVWHPDRHHSSQKRAIAHQNFKMLQDAYNTIKTPEARSHYNQKLAQQRRAILVNQNKVINDNRPLKTFLKSLETLFTRSKNNNQA